MFRRERAIAKTGFRSGRRVSDRQTFGDANERGLIKKSKVILFSLKHNFGTKSLIYPLNGLILTKYSLF